MKIGILYAILKNICRYLKYLLNNKRPVEITIVTRTISFIVKERQRWGGGRVLSCYNVTVFYDFLAFALVRPCSIHSNQLRED